jgi:hypothetical protein
MMARAWGSGTDKSCDELMVEPGIAGSPITERERFPMSPLRMG